MPDPGFMRIVLYFYNNHRIPTLVICGLTLFTVVGYFVIKKIRWNIKERQIWSEATKEDIEQIEKEIDEFDRRKR